jgi:hypothetical protein
MSTDSQCRTFTRQEIIDALIPVAVDMLRDNVESLVKDGEDAMFKTFGNIKRLSDDDLMEYWSDFVAESFFEDNPDIEDVLMVTDNKDKKWVITRLT